MVKLGFHSKAKDWLLKAWLNVCVAVQKGRPLTLVDLYAGDGEVWADDRPDGVIERWEGSSVRMAAAAAKATGGKVRVVVNEISATAFGKLLVQLRPYEEVVAAHFNLDARTGIDSILSTLVPNHHNFVFVDPFSPTEIDVPTLRKVASVTTPGYYAEKTFTRRPEIMFTFMPSALWRAPEGLADRFFGPFDWRTSFRDAKEQDGLPTAECYVTALAASMLDLYPGPCWTYEVKSPKGPIVYYVVFWSTHPLANELYPKIRQYAYRYQSQDVLGKFITLKERVRAIGVKGRPIEGYP